MRYVLVLFQCRGLDPFIASLVRFVNFDCETGFIFVVDEHS
jgi:hypothetical protein